MNAILAISPCSPAAAVSYMEGYSFPIDLIEKVEELEYADASDSYEEQVLDAEWKLLRSVLDCTVKADALERIHTLFVWCLRYDLKGAWIESPYEGVNDAAFEEAVDRVTAFLETL